MIFRLLDVVDQEYNASFKARTMLLGNCKDDVLQAWKEYPGEEPARVQSPLAVIGYTHPVCRGVSQHDTPLLVERNGKLTMADRPCANIDVAFVPILANVNPRPMFLDDWLNRNSSLSSPSLNMQFSGAELNPLKGVVARLDKSSASLAKRAVKVIYRPWLCPSSKASRASKDRGCNVKIKSGLSILVYND